MTKTPLWTIDAMARAMGAAPSGALPLSIDGISIDSRTIAPGDAYFAIKGDVHDGHDFVETALKNGAGLAVVSQAQRVTFAANARLLVVPDVLEGLVALGRASRTRLTAKVLAVTGSVGKTSTKEALLRVLSAQGMTHASVASFNNHWGVPLTLARCPADSKFAVFEIGMNHPGEIIPLVGMVRPHIAVVTTVEPVHLEFFASVEAIADAKAEIFTGVEPGGAAVLNADNPHFARLAKQATAAGVSRIVSFGTGEGADARLIDLSLHAESSAVHANVLGDDITYKIGMPGRHMAMNTLAVLAAASLAGADLTLAALALSEMRAPSGRGLRETLHVPNGTATLIDESYNANPASVAAALNVLGQAAVGPRGRRIAVLGDMLELGTKSAELHRGLADAVTSNNVDKVYCCGPLMRHLFDALPSNVQGAHASDSVGLESVTVGALRPGDVVMVKGSLGSRMKLIVTALQKNFSGDAALGKAAT